MFVLEFLQGSRFFSDNIFNGLPGLILRTEEQKTDDSRPGSKAAEQGIPKTEYHGNDDTEEGKRQEMVCFTWNAVSLQKARVVSPAIDDSVNEHGVILNLINCDIGFG